MPVVTNTNMVGRIIALLVPALIILFVAVAPTIAEEMASNACGLFEANC